MKKWKVKYKLKTLGKFDTEDEAIGFANFFLMCRMTISPSEIKIIGYENGKKISYTSED